MYDLALDLCLPPIEQVVMLTCNVIPFLEPWHLPKLDRQISQTLDQYGQHLACTQEHPTGRDKAMVEEHAVRTRALSTRGQDWLRLEADEWRLYILHLFPVLPLHLIVLLGTRHRSIRLLWIHMNRYIGDAKHGRLVGTDSLGNKYFENYNPYEEVPGASGIRSSVSGQTQNTVISCPFSPTPRLFEMDRNVMRLQSYRSSTMGRLQPGWSEVFCLACPLASSSLIWLLGLHFDLGRTTLTPVVSFQAFNIPPPPRSFPCL